MIRSWKSSPRETLVRIREAIAFDDQDFRSYGQVALL